MKKQILITTLILSLFVLFSCTGGGSTGTSGSGFIGGSEGLSATLSIDSASGGNEVYDNNVDPFKINVNLKNNGEYDVAENTVVITLDGVNFNAFQIRDPTQRNTLPLPGLERQAEGVTDPTQAIVQYDANYRPDEDADRTITLASNICYQYRTVSRVQDLCLRKTITGPSNNASCQVTGIKTAENSGAPFRIKKFSERPQGVNTVQVWIEAENEGQGTLYSKDYLSEGQCIDNTEERNKMYVKVELTEFENSASMISCSGLAGGNEGFVNVIQNKIAVSCNIDTSNLQETTFETPLRVTFDYVYKDSVSTALTIKSNI